jgi:hypothetical protein
LHDVGGGPVERPHVEGAEFYLVPRIATELRLGQIIEQGGEFRAVLTPHCHLALQPGDPAPRADFVLTAKTISAATLFETEPLLGNTDAKRLSDLGRRIQSPAGFGRPLGRYWFLPGFLSMSHRYVDFLQLESLTMKSILEDWISFAVLDIPFAEAFQSSFVRFYSAVGLPVLDPMHFGELSVAPPQRPA